ncbi:MAG: hypothetical protein FJ356_03655 [Thaumarchaeota archaeon]|nr:hypothetical protein [Nitrososphaerota archaeon]
MSGSKKLKFQQTLIPFLLLAFKRSSSLQQVQEWVEQHKFHTNWETIEWQGWRLPATKEKHPWCGIWNTIGCVKEQLHKMLGKGNRVYVKHFQRFCYRACCKECYPRWIVRLANNSTKRIEKYSHIHNKKSIHLFLCPPPSQYHLPIEILQKRAMGIIKKAQIEGGAIILHPFRFKENVRLFCPGPHFHLVCFGTEDKIRSAFGMYGWFIKDCHERRSVFQTFCYLLSHCGVKNDKHALKWFGKLSYNKFKVEKEPKNNKCPVCKNKFVHIFHKGIQAIIQPDKMYEGLLDSDGKWYETKEDPRKFVKDV